MVGGLSLKCTQVKFQRKKPLNLKDDVKLHSYQLDALSWMMHIEDSLDTGTTFPKLINWLPEYKFGEARPVRKFFTVQDVKSTTFRAGVLVDEMGLGKTLEGN